MYESPVLPIRIKAPWKNHQYFFQSYFPYTLFTTKSRNNRRHKSRSLALLCLMFVGSFFILCHYYQSISLDSTSPLNDVMEVTTVSTPLFNPPASSLSSQKSSFLLSSLLWPSQMFSSDMSSSSSSWSPPAQLVTVSSSYEMEKRTQLTHLDPASVSSSSSSSFASSSSSSSSAYSPSSSSSYSSSSLASPSFAPNGSTEKRLPQVIIIGVRKCGTRALLEFLNLHSKIQKARDEVHFFDEDSKYEQGLEWYRSQMPYSYSDQVTIEKTPAYFVTDSAPERIRAMNSSIRLILLVRDPVTRLISDYAQLNANKLAKKERPLRSIEHMVLLSDGSVNVNYRPVKTSIYSYYYAKWAEVFPSSQIHVVDGDHLIDDPYSEVLKVIQFLNLNSDEITRDQFSFNSTKGFYCIKLPGSDVEKCLNETKGRRHPQVDSSVVQILRKFYAPYNRHFYSMVGRDFHWREE